MTWPEAKSVPMSLLDAIRSGDCVAFVGAGLTGAARPMGDGARQTTTWCRELGLERVGYRRVIRSGGARRVGDGGGGVRVVAADLRFGPRVLHGPTILRLPAGRGSAVMPSEESPCSPNPR